MIFFEITVKIRDYFESFPSIDFLPIAGAVAGIRTLGLSLPSKKNPNASSYYPQPCQGFDPRISSISRASKPPLCFSRPNPFSFFVFKLPSIPLFLSVICSAPSLSLLHTHIHELFNAFSFPGGSSHSFSILP